MVLNLSQNLHKYLYIFRNVLPKTAEWFQQTVKQITYPVFVSIFYISPSKFKTGGRFLGPKFVTKNI